VVQAEAEVLYLIRAPKMPEVKSIYERVVNIAKGAALMTDTQMEIRFDKACSNYVPNHEVGTVMHQNLEKFGLPVYEEAEKNFAGEIYEKITKEDKENTLNEIENSSGVSVAEDGPFLTKVTPYKGTKEVLFGSSDVGDVSWALPALFRWGYCFGDEVVFA
jgi:aminobenzoyl-glutamate utilization protein B